MKLNDRQNKRKLKQLKVEDDNKVTKINQNLLLSEEYIATVLDAVVDPVVEPNATVVNTKIADAVSVMVQTPVEATLAGASFTVDAAPSFYLISPRPWMCIRRFSKHT
jgi:hypothetical protein